MPNATSTPERLLDAATRLIRQRGLAATSVDELCRAAGVTKGAFFHHFASKEALAVAAAEHWSRTTALFASAPYHRAADPVDRVLEYVRFRRAILDRPVAEFTCLAGTMVQEAFETHPAIRDACADSMLGHAATLVPDIQAAMDQRGVGGSLGAEGLAIHIQATMQGAFILAKATGTRAVAEESFDHLLRYLTLLFNHPTESAS